MKASSKNFFTKISWGQIFLHLVMAFLLICMIYPLLMSVWCAFKTINQYDISKFYPSILSADCLCASPSFYPTTSI